jgi:hypothetical protein
MSVEVKSSTSAGKKRVAGISTHNDTHTTFKNVTGVID